MRFHAQSHNSTPLEKLWSFWSRRAGEVNVGGGGDGGGGAEVAVARGRRHLRAPPPLHRPLQRPNLLQQVGLVLEANQLPLSSGADFTAHALLLCCLFALIKVFKIIKIEEGMTTEIYATSVAPIGAMFAMTLWLGNSAYLYISVAFAQMLKAVMPVAVFFLGAAAGLEELSCRMFLIMSAISFGVIVASYGEVTISWVGVVYQMGGVIAEALRLIFIEIFLKKKGVKLNIISMMYYVSPCSALCLFVPWIFLEKPKMDSSGSWNFPPVTLFFNCLCTFLLNLSVFVVISRTSALTARVTGVVRDWVVVLFSALIFADTKLTVINIIGYAIAIAGVVGYNKHKLKVGTSPTASSQSNSNHNNPESSQDVQIPLVPPKEAA
uniref:Sugar phosphate transporter domain-containing protein n=1 Tax=Ananas comosus var. bracteatus TaxID=296719 RepID=A0A6V7PMQ6_ANACO|nr:unnamed protein product [Ananas comosus var. bracteatus]